jgi:ribosomal protein S27E
MSLRSLTIQMKDEENRTRTAREEILDKQYAVIKRYVVTCEHCGKSSTLGKWSFIQDYWYTPPRGCTEGDYWNATKTECCYIACPHCRVMNYIYNHPQKQKLLERIEPLRFDKEKVFAEIWEQYKNQPLKKIHPAG